MPPCHQVCPSRPPKLCSWRNQWGGLPHLSKLANFARHVPALFSTLKRSEIAPNKLRVSLPLSPRSHLLIFNPHLDDVVDWPRFVPANGKFPFLQKREFQFTKMSTVSPILLPRLVSRLHSAFGLPESAARARLPARSASDLAWFGEKSKRQFHSL